MNKISIIVATHKKYKMPESKYFIPLQVGKAINETDFGYLTDDTGENISAKNPFFCELTGLYWAWKNLESEYIGLVHYRRNFTMKKKFKRLFVKDKMKLVLNDNEIEDLICKSSIILPKKRNYYIETIYSHYEHTMHIEPLDEAGKIIEEKYPEYKKEFENLKIKRKMHAFNMFIMKKEFLNEYCTWLFDILFELEKRISPNQYDKFHARYLGRVSERLLDVWLYTKGYSFIEVPVLDIERINWFKKGKSFLKAKFSRKKYEKSF